MKHTMTAAELGRSLSRAAKNSLAPGRIGRVVWNHALALAGGFLLGNTALFGVCAPFGPGFAATLGETPQAASAAVGVMLGAVGGYGLLFGLRSAASALLICAAFTLLRSLKLTRRRFFAPLTACVLTAVIGSVYLRFGDSTGVTVFSWLAEALLAGGSCVLFRAGLRNQREDAHSRAGLAALAMALCMSLGGFVIAETISIGRCAAALLVMLAALTGGAAQGALTGLLLGAALDAAGIAAPGVCALSLGCAGALCGVGGKRGRLSAAMGAVLGNAAAAFWAAPPELRTGLVYEFFIASVLLLLLPQKLIEHLRRSPDGGSGAGLVHYLQGRTGLAASAFTELSALLRAVPEAEKSDDDLFAAFDVAAEEVCRGCRERERCWGREYEETRSALLSALPAMQTRGTLTPEDLPLRFRDRCLLVRSFSETVGREWKAVLRRRQTRKRLQADRELLSRQYADFASLLRDLTALSRGNVREETKLTRQLERCLREYAPGTLASVFRDENSRLHAELSGAGRIGLTRKAGWLEAVSRALGTEMVCPEPGAKRLQLFEREPLEAEIGVAACCRGGKSPSGDAARSFKTAEGVLYLIVADGMGSGADAAAESSEVSALAEKLLRAGAGADTVMRLLNTALLLRSEKRMTSLSLDLMSVNLFSGETCVYKYGAAPSYVRAGRQVRTVLGGSPAAGTDDVGPDCTRLQLDSGSAAVILSDGAAKAESVSEKLLGCAPGALQELAGSILTEAAANGGWEDDMTVLTLSLMKRGEPAPS